MVDKYIVSEKGETYEKNKGFDVIIGNPPFGALFSAAELNYIKSKYNTAVWRVESYLIFIEQASKLLSRNGLLGLIIPDTLLNLEFTQPARELLLRNSNLQEIVGLPSNVFVGATVDTIILLTEKTDYSNSFHPSDVLVKSFGKKQIINSITKPSKEFYVKTKYWYDENAFNIKTDIFEKSLLIKIESGKKIINDVADILYGIKTYQVGKGKPPQTKKIRDDKPFTSDKKLDDSWLPFYDGKNIGRYQLLWENNNWLHYGNWLAEPRRPAVFEGEKILIRKIIGKTLISTYVGHTSYCNTLLFILKLKEKKYSYKSVLAVLNSALMGWYFRNKFQISDDDTFPQIMIRDILQFPIAAIDKENKSIYEELNQLTETMLQLNKEKQQTTPSEKLEQLKARIQYTDDKINRLVYRLYGLSEEEVRVVEGDNKLK
ncbi:MAG: TaqI-like C-terminal specificity domain-containing protein [Ginsengibacter sp.]